MVRLSNLLLLLTYTKTLTATHRKIAFISIKWTCGTTAKQCASSASTRGSGQENERKKRNETNCIYKKGTSSVVRGYMLEWNGNCTTQLFRMVVCIRQRNPAEHKGGLPHTSAQSVLLHPPHLLSFLLFPHS